MPIALYLHLRLFITPHMINHSYSRNKRKIFQIQLLSAMQNMLPCTHWTMQCNRGLLKEKKITTKHYIKIKQFGSYFF